MIFPPNDAASQKRNQVYLQMMQARERIEVKKGRSSTRVLRELLSSFHNLEKEPLNTLILSVSELAQWHEKTYYQIKKEIQSGLLPVQKMETGYYRLALNESFLEELGAIKKPSL